MLGKRGKGALYSGIEKTLFAEFFLHHRPGPGFGPLTEGKNAPRIELIGASGRIDPDTPLHEDLVSCQGRVGLTPGISFEENSREHRFFISQGKVGMAASMAVNFPDFSAHDKILKRDGAFQE
jgi:hypothetical protein